jgi:hypothetical protein
MATVLEDCTTEEQGSVVRFLWGKELNAKKNIYKEMFHVYGGKCFSRKAVHKGIEKMTNITLMMKWLKRMCGSG